MTCKAFRLWLTDNPRQHDQAIPEKMEAHMEQCDQCRRLFSMDNTLEKSIVEFFQPEPMPHGLVKQVDIALDHIDDDFKAPSAQEIFKPAATVTAALVLAAFAVFVFMLSQPFKYKNLQQLSTAVVESHLKKDTTMTFGADDIETAAVNMTRELNFNVILPDLRPKGYTLVGGRLCVLEKCEIAYLFYEKEGKLCSLYIMDYNHLDFSMADGSRFKNRIKGCATDIWKDNGQVYALVH